MLREFLDSQTLLRVILQRRNGRLFVSFVQWLVLFSLLVEKEEIGKNEKEFYTPDLDVFSAALKCRNFFVGSSPSFPSEPSTHTWLATLVRTDPKINFPYFPLTTFSMEKSMFIIGNENTALVSR